MPTNWTAGDVVAGRYRLEEVVGRGGMGVVWRVEHVRLGRAFALKLLARELSSNAHHERFLREARAAAAIGGRNVVEVFDFGVDRGAPYIAMELLSGESLAARLERERRIEPRIFVGLFAEIAAAIERAHRLHIVHRDIKPSNVHLAIDEDPPSTARVGALGTLEARPREVVKVLDFGIAKILDGMLAGDDITTTGAVLGTGHYMSPEQARGTREIDPRSDLWSLGVLAFHCLTGELPIQRATAVDLLIAIVTEPIRPPSSIDPRLPASLDAWFARATRRSPDARFGSAREMSDALAAAFDA
ncbi:MAG: serine/threonine-protein kinase [Polyangiaceae bacterium]